MTNEVDQMKCGHIEPKSVCGLPIKGEALADQALLQKLTQVITLHRTEIQIRFTLLSKLAES